MGQIVLISFGQVPEPEVPRLWSVTALWRLNSCHLRAAYDCDRDVSDFLRRGSLYTALGNAAHALEEAVHRGDFDAEDETTLEAAIDRCWSESLILELDLLQAQWPEYRIPRMRDLPRYATIYCNATGRAAESIRSRVSTALPHQYARVEQTLVDEDNAILGRPDRYVVDGDGFSVFDIKSGVVDSEISPAHRHQLLTYCHLIERETALTPKAIAIQDIEGHLVSEKVSSVQVAEHISTILESRSRFLKRVGNTREWKDSASPSQEACRFCDYRVICPAYWGQPADDIHEHDFKGSVISVPMPGVFTLSPDHKREGQPEIVSVSGYEQPIKPGAHVAVTGGWLVGNVLRAAIGTRVFEVRGQKPTDPIKT